MSATPAQIAANILNAQSSTGPRTEEGLAASSKNATTHGLFATHDFIRPGEEPFYEELNESLFEQLSPIGILECNLVDEIRRAMWRLRRCGLVEESLAASCDPAGLDAMQIEAHAKLQTSVDRARSQAHRLLHKCTAELRKLQTERLYRNESFEEGTDVSYMGIADWPAVETRLQKRNARTAKQRSLQLRNEIDALCGAPMPAPDRSASFCKTAEPPAPIESRAA